MSVPTSISPSWMWFYDRLDMYAPILSAGPQMLGERSNGLSYVGGTPDLNYGPGGLGFSGFTESKYIDCGFGYNQTISRWTINGVIRTTDPQPGEWFGSGDAFNDLTIAVVGAASTDNNVEFGFRDPTLGTLYVNVVVDEISDGMPHLITGTYDGTDLKLYVDGTLRASGTATVNRIAIGYNYKIGGFDDSGTIAPFGGEILMASHHRYAFTAEQVAALALDPWGPATHYRDTSPGAYQYFIPTSDSFEVHTPTKPQLWNVDPAFVTPNYQWFWEYNVTAAVAFLGPNNVKAELVQGKDFQLGAVVSLDLHEGYGWGLDCTGSTGDNGARIPNDTSYDITGDLTMVWYGIVDANVGSGVNILMCTYENVSPYEGDLLAIYTGTPNKYIRFFRGDGTASTSPKETGAVIVPGEPVVIIVRHRVSNGAYTIHLNGVNVASNNTYTRTPVGGGHGFHLGSSSDNALKSDSRHFAAYMLNDFISDDQVQQLTKDPYGPVRHYRDTQPGPYQYFNPEVSLTDRVLSFPSKPHE